MGTITLAEAEFVPHPPESGSDAEHRADRIDEFREVMIQVADIQVVQGSEVLSGRVHIIPLALTFPSGGDTVLLSQHLKLAKIIIDYVRDRIMFSSNYPNRRSPEHPASISMISDLAHQIDYVRKGKTQEDKVHRSIACGVGNCGEMIFVGMQCPDIGATCVEAYKLAKPGDHTFLIIGRDANTDPQDPSTWNPETVVCDPWADAFYPAERMKDFLVSYLRLLHIKYKKIVTSCSPIIMRFNPKIHRIKPCRQRPCLL